MFLFGLDNLVLVTVSFCMRLQAKPRDIMHYLSITQSLPEPRASATLSKIRRAVIDAFQERPTDDIEEKADTDDDDDDDEGDRIWPRRSHDAGLGTDTEGEEDIEAAVSVPPAEQPGPPPIVFSSSLRRAAFSSSLRRAGAPRRLESEETLVMGEAVE